MSRQTRPTDGLVDKQTNLQMCTQADRNMAVWTGRRTDRRADRLTETLTDRHTVSQAEECTERRTD
jgi:hypothetical protein